MKYESPAGGPNFPRVLTILGRRGHVIEQAFRGVGLGCSYQRRLFGPRRLYGVLYETARQILNNKYEKFDVVLTDSVEYTALSWVVAKLIKKPLVVRVRGNSRAELNQEKSCGEYAIPGIKYIVDLYERILRNCAAVIPVSRSLLSYLMNDAKVDEKKLFWIPISIETDAFSKIDRESARKALGLCGKDVILTVTNFRFTDKVKKLEELLPTILELLEAYPDTVFLIAGDGTYLRTFKKNISKVATSQSDRVRCLGYVRDMATLYAAASIVVYFSGLDAFPRAILEAQGSARPVIANPIGGVPEIIRHEETGYIVNSNAEFIRTARLLLDKKDLQRKIGENARMSVVQNYTPHIVGSKWVEVLTELLSR